MGYKVLEMDLDAAWKKIAAYTYSEENEEYVKSPKEFEKDGGGDCEDFAIYMMYLLGPESRIIVISTSLGKHAIIKYDNKYIEPQIYGYYYDASSLVVLYSYNYDYIMEAATDKGTKNITGVYP